MLNADVITRLNRYNRLVKIYWIRFAFLMSVLTAFLFLLSHGPVRRLNIYSEINDIRIGRMDFEPFIPINWTSSDWLPIEYRRYWRQCMAKPCTIPETKPSKQIPKRIHQMYKTTQIPDRYQNYVKTWITHNPDYEYWFWSDEDIRLFISDHYPEFLELYDSYSFNIQRSDVARYFILEKFGGIYSDLDYSSLRPLDNLIAEHSCILSHGPSEQSILVYQEEILVTNSIMASVPNHPIFRAVIRTLSEAKSHTESRRGKILVTFDGRWTIYLTGPMVLSRVYDHYVTNTCCQQVRHFKTYLAPAEKLCPMIDGQKAEFFRQICSQIEYQGTAHDILLKQRRACAKLAEADFKPKLPPDAYARHDWLHLGYQNENKMNKVSIFDTVHPTKVYTYQKDIRNKYKQR